MEAKEDHENDTFRNVADHGGTTDSTDCEPLSLDSSNTGCFCENQVEAVSHFVNNNGVGVGVGITGNNCKRSYKRSSPSKENRLVAEERKLRKERFWMLVRVLMRYVEKKDIILFKKARATLENCAHRNVRKEPRFTNLIESVQRELKHTVGTRYWRRAEHHVAKHLLKQASEKALEDALVKEASSFGSLDEFTPFPLQEHPREQAVVDPFLLETAFAPPPPPPPSHNHGGNWRDASIPTNVAIPTKRPAEQWTLGCDYHQSPPTSSISGNCEVSSCTNDSYHDDLPVGTEMDRKRRKHTPTR
jgi:hypothetical protein